MGFFSTSFLYRRMQIHWLRSNKYLLFRASLLSTDLYVEFLYDREFSFSATMKFASLNRNELIFVKNWQNFSSSFQKLVNFVWAEWFLTSNTIETILKIFRFTTWKNKRNFVALQTSRSFFQGILIYRVITIEKNSSGNWTVFCRAHRL